MTNPYIPDEVALAPGDIARSDDVNARYESTVSGFDKLPIPASGKRGFGEPVPVSDPTDADHAATKAYVDSLLAQQVIDAQSAQAAAELAQSNAELAQAASELSLDYFNDRYLGSKTSDPVLDNDGDDLIEGALYWNTAIPAIRVYDGATWVTPLTSNPAAEDVAYTPAGTGAVATTLKSKLQEHVSINDFGGVGDGAAENAGALIAAGAATTGEVLIPAGTFKVTATAANVAGILALLNRINAVGVLNITIDADTHALTAQVPVQSLNAKNIFINGADTVSTTATSQISVSGSAKAYSVIMGVASSAGIAVNDYALVRQDVTGTGDYDIHAGVWKVTAVDSGGANRLTLLNTSHSAAFPTNTLTGGTVVALKTILQFTGCDGFRFEGEALGVLDKVAIVGDYNVAAATGTTGAHGIVTSSPVITGGGSSNADYDTDGTVRLGNSVGVSGFGEQGVAISGRSNMIANFLTSCSNRKRGIYAEGGHIRCKFSCTNGNGEDGNIADTTGFIQAANSISSGNGLNGFWSTNLSLINCSGSRASNNISDGYEARGLTRLAADSSFASNNGGKGYQASDGGMIDADSAIADGNTLDGYYAQSGGIIDCDNSISTDNGGWGYESEIGGTIRAAGSTATGNASGSYNHLTGSIVIDNTGVVKDYAWQAGAAPAFDSVTFVDAGSTFEYKLVDNSLVFWKCRMAYNTLDTADISTITISPFTLAPSGRFGGIEWSIRTSTGISLLATDTYQPNYNSISNSIVFIDNAGTLMKYNSGKINASGVIEISGWYEI